MGKFLVARLNEPLQAYHGEGDHAPDASFANMQKAIRIVDDTGRQRLGRQLFLPKAKEYQSAFSIVHFGESDTGLTKALAIYDTNKQLFEV